MTSDEQRLITTFVTPPKRDRYCEFLSNKKHRQKFTRELAHFKDWDERFIQRVPPNAQNPDGIEELLVALGAPELCRAISEDSNVDGKELELRDALGRVIGAGFGTVLSCVPGKVAYFEGEDMSTRYLLVHGND